MSTNKELLVALDTESWPISTERLADKLGVTRDNIVPQLEQFNQKAYVTNNEEGQWSITQTGKKLLLGGLNDKEKNETTPQAEFAPEPLTATDSPQAYQ